MKRKKVFFLLPAGLLALSLLVFCGGCKKGEEAVAAGNTAGFNETGFPIVDEPLTLTAVATKGQATPDLNTLEFFQKMETLTNIHIDFTYGGNEADWATQKSLLLASGDLPDMFFGTCLLESDVIMNRELFIPLDDLIQKYGHNIQVFFREEAGIKPFGTAYDGKMWGLPRKNYFMPMSSTVWMINSLWLQKLGLSMPETTDQFYEVLKAFKTGDPNGNGIADEIPMSIIGSPVNERQGGFMDLLCAFGVVENDNGEWVSVTDGKVQFIAAQDGFRDAVAWLHKLYAEGLIDSEVFTQDASALSAKNRTPFDSVTPETIGVTAGWHRFGHLGNQGRVAAQPIDNKEWNVYVKSLHEMATPLAPNEYLGRMYNVVLPPLKGPEGHQFWRWNPEATQSAKYSFEITKSNKYPEVTMRWVDNLYEPVNSFQMFNGPIGSHIIDNGDGTYVLVDRPPSTVYAGDWQNNFAYVGPGANFDSWENLINCEDITIWNQREDKKAYIPYYPKEYYPNLAFSPEELDQLVIFKQDILNTSKEQFANWIVNGGVEQEYDAFVQRLNTMGLPDMVKIYQTAYDRYKTVK